MTPVNKKLDLKLQSIQKDLLKHTLPIAKVMETLSKLIETSEKIDVREILGTHSHNFNLVDSANINLVKQRKEIIRKDLATF